MPHTAKTVAYQGIEGSYSHTICKRHFPEATLVGCSYFEDVLAHTQSGQSDAACIPIENNLGGRVAEIHHLLTQTTLYIVAEYFIYIDHCLLGYGAGSPNAIRTIYSHPQALIQCRDFIVANGYTELVDVDTAAAAQRVARGGNPSCGAIASAEAAKIYRLNIVARNIANNHHNITRFILMQKTPLASTTNSSITSILFQLASLPAALHQALGGFARQSINLIKIESYIDPTHFNVAQFYIEIEGAEKNPLVQKALSVLKQYSDWMRILGSYPMAGERHKFNQKIKEKIKRNVGATDSN